MGIDIAAYNVLETLSSLAGSERGGCSPLSGFELLSNWHQDSAKFANNFEVCPLNSSIREECRDV